ncbi:hypothetical protein BED46_015380 [Burkholderia contaminans]|uniref:Uncharacterized protein n=1 Tax=Burkholderia contaminans LMG 23361 TaxID=1334628 RepID=A0ABD4AQW0_9BURK|nr:hypothetical protein WR31_23275 [Burkholderia contaminans LMG 23361]ODN22766.1 hypothetical protein BGI28_06960 [Burkholderia contaminans]OMI84141.1 hypothetical protein BED46_015380 [Burkholderia contaminans]
MPNAQTRQDAARSHFYAGESERAVPVRECAGPRAACRPRRTRGCCVDARGLAVGHRTLGAVVAHATYVA